MAEERKPCEPDADRTRQVVREGYLSAVYDDGTVGPHPDLVAFRDAVVGVGQALKRSARSLLGLDQDDA